MLGSFSTSKETNPFDLEAQQRQEQTNNRQEFSKSLTNVAKSANRLKSQAYVEFYLRDIPRAIWKEFAAKYNHALEAYRRGRRKIGEIEQLGYKPSDKLFTVEELFDKSASVFQSIADQLKQYPKKKFAEETTDSRQPIKPEKGSSLAFKLKRLALAGAIISPAIIAACSPQEATQEVNPTQSLSEQTDDGQTIDLEPSPSLTDPTEVDPAVTAEVTPEELNRLNADINSELQQAVEEVDVLTRLRFENQQNAEAAAAMFANSLTSTENPGGPILDPSAFSVGISPDGVAYLKIEVDSPWGPAGKVAVVDTGEAQGMFVTLGGAGLEEGELSLEEQGYYAAAKNLNGEIVKVVGANRQWSSLAEAEKLPETDLSRQLAEAYLNGEIEYPSEGLTEEQKAAFEAALVEAEASLTYEQRRNLIEDRWQYGNKAFEALVKDDGNLEYYDGSWHTLEAMKNLNGEIIPWGEMYDLQSEEGRNNLIANVLAGDEGIMSDYVQIFNIVKQNAEQKGFDSTNFNVLFLQFFPDVEQITINNLSDKIVYYDMTGLIVIKNNMNKLLVIRINTCINSSVIMMHINSKQTFSHNPSDLYDLKYFQNGFLGIMSNAYLKYKYDSLSQVLEKSEEQSWMEKIFDSDIENILNNLKTDPNLIGEGLYSILQAIDFN